ncbi:MAG: fatty acid desaturase [Paracoccaceae bacterium]
MNKNRRRGVEWLTLAIIAGCYSLWALLVFVLPLPVWLSVLLLIPLLTLHSSLQHEVIHGHPLPSRFWSAALVYLPLGLFIPYERFRDQHLHHHLDSNLTDPYDDPESAYMDPPVWARLPRLLRLVLMFNNTLFGRMLIGPLVSQFAFMRNDWREIFSGNRAILRVWLVHFVLSAGLVALVLRFGHVSLPGYILATYFGLSVLKIRTFLEHQAHLRASGRTVIIEDRGPLAWLFLNNNLHAVHHAHPKLAWYELPEVYAENRTHFLRRNHGYTYKSYAQVFRNYALRRKEPVPHPLRHE